jgi:hypothetical protein
MEFGQKQKEERTIRTAFNWSTGLFYTHVLKKEWVPYTISLFNGPIGEL